MCSAICIQNHRVDRNSALTPFIQIVGIVAIFFAVELDKAELPAETDYLLIAFVAFHFLMHLVLSILMCSTDMRKDKVRAYEYTQYFLIGTARNF